MTLTLNSEHVQPKSVTAQYCVLTDDVMRQVNRLVENAKVYACQVSGRAIASVAAAAANEEATARTIATIASRSASRDSFETTEASHQYAAWTWTLMLAVIPSPLATCRPHDTGNQFVVGSDKWWSHCVA
jgi:hypothetical protein